METMKQYEQKVPLASAQRKILTIDGRQIEAKEGQSVLAAALAAGIYIPHLCHHPALQPQGGCKLCSVEIEGMAGTVTSCNTPAAEGMVVKTKTKATEHVRQVAMELLMASHPADCTSCAAYLNCELLALLQYLGVAHSRLRRVDKQNINVATGPANSLIKREMERCIQCGRCVRACEEMRGVGALAFLNRNGESYVGIKDNAALTASDCRFCGACVEVCPTGAIQDMPGIFKTDIPRDQALVPCKNGCPAHTDIPEYIRLTEEGKYGDAVSVIREKLTFPHVLGVVCTHKCEYDCKRGHLDDSVTIRSLKRYAVEQDKEMAWKEKVTRLPATGKKVAIIGGGPTGLTAAWHLARKGHSVTVFEKQPKLDGMMRYGIPEYRLDRQIVEREIQVILDMGVEVHCDADVANAVELLVSGKVSPSNVGSAEKYDAVLVAVGAQRGGRTHLDVAGCGNVWTAVEFCRRAAKGDLSDNIGNCLTVIGGGNVAFDCAGIAKRAGVEKVQVACLESREGMLADKEEIQEALEEGIEIWNNITFTDVEKENNKVSGIRGLKVKHFSFGPNGLELETEADSEELFVTDSLVFATGQQIDLDDSFGLTLGRANSVVTDGTMQASVPGVFAAGDAITGTRAIVDGIASGTRAAGFIDRFLGGDGNVEETYFKKETPSAEIGVVKDFAQMKRCDQGCLSADDAKEQAVRCLQCDLRLQIPKVKFWTDPCYSKGKLGSKEAGV